MRKSSDSASFSLPRSKGSFPQALLFSLMTSQTNTFTFSEIQQRICSPVSMSSLSLGRHYSRFRRLFRHWWAMWQSSGQWCVGVVRYTQAFHAWLLKSHTRSFRKIGFQKESRGYGRRPQSSGRWNDPGSLNHVLKGCLEHSHLTMVWARNKHTEG